jgi:hypothetical protein
MTDDLTAAIADAVAEAQQTTELATGFTSTVRDPERARMITRYGNLCELQGRWAEHVRDQNSNLGAKNWPCPLEAEIRKALPSVSRSMTRNEIAAKARAHVIKLWNEQRIGLPSALDRALELIESWGAYDSHACGCEFLGYKPCAWRARYDAAVRAVIEHE